MAKLIEEGTATNQIKSEKSFYAKSRLIFFVLLSLIRLAITSSTSRKLLVFNGHMQIQTLINYRIISS